MRAIRIDQPGGPEVMRLEDVELPPPEIAAAVLLPAAEKTSAIKRFTGCRPPNPQL